MRSQIAAKAPMGVQCPIQELQKEQFPRFEMIDLVFDLNNLEDLTSAQLAVSTSSFSHACKIAHHDSFSLIGRHLPSQYDQRPRDGR